MSKDKEVSNNRNSRLKGFRPHNLSVVIGSGDSCSDGSEDLQDVRGRMQSFAINVDDSMPESTVFVEDSDVMPSTSNIPFSSSLRSSNAEDAVTATDMESFSFVKDIFAKDTRFFHSKEAETNFIEEIFTEKPPKILRGYLFGNLIGEGSYSKVKEVLNIKTLVRRAVKIIKDKRLRKIPGGEQNVQREIEVLRELDHQNVVKVIEIFRIEEKQKLYIVMEYCVCSLQQLLDNCEEKMLPEFQAHLYFVQMIEGLDFLHSQRIIHKDIKPGNLLLSLNGELKICDLGVAELLEADEGNGDWCTLVQGTPKFQPPEVVSGQQKKFRGRLVDIWSCGVTLYNIVSGEYPFDGDVIMKLFESIINKPLRMPSDVQLSDQLVQLLSGILQKNPDQRWDTLRIRTCKWFSSEHEIVSRNELLIKSKIVKVPAVKDVESHRPLGVYRYLAQLYGDNNGEDLTDSHKDKENESQAEQPSVSGPTSLSDREEASIVADIDLAVEREPMVTTENSQIDASARERRNKITIGRIRAALFITLCSLIVICSILVLIFMALLFKFQRVIKYYFYKMLAHDFLNSKKENRNSIAPTSTRSAWYFIVLVISKVARCTGIFFVDLLATQIHVISLLWLLRTVILCVLLPAQKPFTSGKPIRKSYHVRIAQLAFFNCLVEILWFYGITFCGPLRSILIFEQSPTVILIAAMTIVNGSGNAAKTRGLVCLFVGWVVLFIMDSDSPIINHAEAHRHQSGLNHVFYHIVGWFGMSDHSGGVLLLLFAVVLRMVYDSNFRHLAVEIGGPKRLYALVSLLTATFLAPFAILILAFSTSYINSYLEFPLLVCLAAAFVMVVDFYSEHICFQHVADPVMAIARWSPITMFLTSAFLSLLWLGGTGSSVVWTTHGISAGILITIVCFCIASFVLTSQDSPRSIGGHFIGISEDGMPLFTHGEAFLEKTSRSLLRFFRETLREILANSDSQRIFWFLCANLAFCGVEFIYGFWTNSLGLISDGFHMLFDCSALVMGLVASVMARWTASRHFSYGYGRVEVLSGFINALFLIVIALFIFLEAVERLYDPPDVHTDKLLFVAVAGLFVNLFGMYAFHGGHDHGHSAGEGSECKDGGDASHGHSHSQHGHSHAHGHSHSHGHSHGNANMQGVFLHVLADTLGSVFVIISTLLIQSFGWTWVDPLCSLILSMLILGSVVPLLKSSASVLLQSIPDDIDEKKSEQMLNEIEHIEGVLGCGNMNIWELKAGVNVASLVIQVHWESNDQNVRRATEELLKKHGIHQTTIQIEREPGKSYHSHDYSTHQHQSKNPKGTAEGYKLEIGMG